MEPFLRALGRGTDAAAQSAADSSGGTNKNVWRVTLRAKIGGALELKIEWKTG